MFGIPTFGVKSIFIIYIYSYINNQLFFILLVLFY
jgi:hypothetical protein